MDEYQNLTDDELALQSRRPDPAALEALIARYGYIGRALAGRYRIAGLDSDDVTQEAAIGLLKAVRSFDPSQKVPFRAYAMLCMRRQVMSAAKAGMAGKQQPLSNYVPLEGNPELPVWSEDHRTASPESIVIQDEEADTRSKHIQSLLSAFEQEALNLYLSGHSYEEMSKRLDTSVKSVDNALQRVRRKLRSMKL